MTDTTAHTKVVLITGASRGIGAATARLAAARGYAVAVNYRADRAAADKVQSSRRATSGSRRIATRAGRHDAIAIVHTITTSTRSQLTGSAVVIPYCNDASALPREAAAAAPIATPTMATSAPSRSTARRTRVGDAPSAVRTQTRAGAGRRRS